MSADSYPGKHSSTLTGLHLLLTYQCNYECDHCFVWGSPFQTGTMTIETIEHILAEAESLGTIDWIYFEGGEAFLYYPVLLGGILRAKALGFHVGIVTNAYWATADADAAKWLRPLAGLVDQLSVSSDGYHGSDQGPDQPGIARRAAKQLGIPTGLITIAEPGTADVPESESAVTYRGRAAELLASRADAKHWEQFSECPWEDLRQPGRVHVDPFGHLHICQGISIGNMLECSLAEIMADFDPDTHPIVGPLLAGGPAELVRRYDLPHKEGYADHCHLCYESRRVLRQRFPDELTPDQMYRTA
ncbi:MAG: radical SAM protein [Woeseiaceae bacterium]|nr:radical SAM protein [Woeseiaceae bacterium]